MPNLGVIPDFSSSLAVPTSTHHFGEIQSTNRGGKRFAPRSGHSNQLWNTNISKRILSRSENRSSPLAGRKPSQIILITSALPDEGKTAVAVNTGIVLAHTGAQVLIIDADLEEDLVVTKFCPWTESMWSHRDVDGECSGRGCDLYRDRKSILFSSGKIPASPSELLGSTRMGALLATLSKTYDYIVIDSPPVMAVADLSPSRSCPMESCWSQRAGKPQNNRFVLRLRDFIKRMPK